jgi:alpha-L-fucosidase
MDPRLQWWQEARFGMFVHWGPVSLRGTEIGWSRGAQVPSEEYDSLATRFNPVQFDAAAWARTAREAGMKYLVLTSKHHDGFCLWDSKHTDYDIMNTPFHRDVVKELAEACAKEGVVFCLYHSICDWRHPDYPLGSPGGKSKKPSPDMDRYNTYLKEQLRELLTGYGRIGILWFDGEWEAPWTEARGQDLYKFVRGLQPGLIVNNRVGNGREDMAGSTKAGAFAGDYDTPEQRVGKYQDTRPWESCITICQQWAWKPDDAMKSLKQCLRTLIVCAGGDGNLLFNVGPMPDGRIEPRQVARLQEMGEWMKKYGATIYGTRGGPFKPGSWGASTRKGNSITLHLFEIPDAGIRLPALPRKVVRSSLLTGGQVDVRQDGDGILVKVAKADRQDVATLVSLELDGSAETLEAVELPSRSVAAHRQAKASNVYQKMADHGPSKAVDDDVQTRWATDSGTRAAWLEVDLGRSETFDRVEIEEAYAGRVRKFELQVPDGAGWRCILAGETLGAAFKAQFPPVTSARVRLNILEAADGPTINELRLLRPGD